MATLLQHAARPSSGISGYSPPGTGYGPHIDDASVEEARRSDGGLLQQQPITQLRWYLADLEDAQSQADAGFLQRADQLYRAMARDGTLAGLLATRTAGLVRLPKRFYGSNATIVDSLKAKNGSRSVFDDMFPPSELTAIAADGDVLGVGVGELCPVEGRDYPVLVRLDPEFLQYVWTENRWYYVSRVGRIPITPGDGHWVLLVPGGRIAPWRWGLWPALGRAFINKEHAMSTRASFIASVANPARVIEAPTGATELQRRHFFGHVMRWGPNTVLEMPVGWQAKLLELTGRAWEVFQKEIDTCNDEYMIALAGQIVTTTGGVGFSNNAVPAGIRWDPIKASAENLGYTLNTQGLPQYVLNGWGEEALEAGTSVEWDTTQPRDMEAQARTLSTLATALAAMATALAGSDKEIDIAQIAEQFGVPLKEKPPGSARGLLAAKPSAPTPEGQERAAQ